ncbi:hypothetical protein TSOC_007844 [Tetrabaena socialis]|uniref:Uncharacterized protein n=1 Tax=Tetrabaena socialis TaxID=47790 RepID=A0A2J8A007_9CHLO|nr:hypothetical protein TSOC_007844 [Tetrabaena socialis]|eukprot:PNH05861.1 hypothetical protein TSOC_007844 [Tetrabaena socialis]
MSGEGPYLSYSHDGLLGCVERSSHLEEYTRSRPASAGSRPRSLLSKVATAAAAAQVDEEPEPVDAEPWILEGWGDGPSVSEAAQQAALKLGPYLKNVPTTLVGLGAGTRRVLSAGPQGRNGPLKASEARRKHGPSQQVERRASGPAIGIASGGGGPYSPSPRRAPPPKNLEVGDESDGEPSCAAPAAGGQMPAAAVAAQPPVYAYSGQPRAGPALRTGAGSIHAAPLGQPQAQGGPGTASASASGSAASLGSPRHRSLSFPGRGAASPQPQLQPSGSAGYDGPAPGAAGKGSPAPGGPQPYSHPSLPPHPHLEPLSPMSLRHTADGNGRGDAGSGEPASSPSPPPPLPGLFLAGRRGSSFRTETGLSGWDPEAPAIQLPQPQHPAPSGSNLSLLWIGPAAPGAGTSGLQIGPVSSGRGSPVAANQQRREQIGGSSRLLQRGAAGGGGAAPATPAELSPAPDRQDRGASFAGQAAQGGYAGREGRPSGSRSSARAHQPQPASPDGLPPQLDALAEFYASRVEPGGGGGGGGAGAGPPPRSGGGTATGLLPVPPMRVTGLLKPTAARV